MLLRPSINNVTKIYKQLEMMFMKQYAPNPLLVKKGLKHKVNLKFEASSYATHHPLSAYLI